MSAPKTVKLGSKGEYVKDVQRAINRHGPSRGIGPVKVDGEAGHETYGAAVSLAHALGVSPASGSEKAAARRTLVLLHPERRTLPENARARAWRKSRNTGPQAAILWATAQIGTREATGNNDGAKVRDWQRWCANGDTYFDGAPYCGIGCANAAIRHSHVRGVTNKARWASVGFIEDDAKAKRNGFTGWSTANGAGQPGDLVVEYGYGVHVEMIVRRIPGGYRTVGFNTSNGLAGSQAEGNGVFGRNRPDSVIRGVAHVNYGS